jgi:hypothetical protein
LAYNADVENGRLHSIEVNLTWDGRSIPDFEKASVRLATGPERWTLHFSAPFDPQTRLPTALPGPTEGLWEYEVSELFVAGEDGHYLEVEVGPYGHFAAFYFEQIRQRKRNIEVLHSSFERQVLASGHGRFEAELQLSCADIPAGMRRWNAYRISGNPEARRYFAAHPVMGDAPDFHRLDCFAKCPA